jgi:hypothetical protein
MLMPHFLVYFSLALCSQLPLMRSRLPHRRHFVVHDSDEEVTFLFLLLSPFFLVAPNSPSGCLSRAHPLLSSKRERKQVGVEEVNRYEPRHIDHTWEGIGHSGTIAE